MWNHKNQQYECNGCSQPFKDGTDIILIGKRYIMDNNQTVEERYTNDVEDKHYHLNCFK